MNHEPVDTRVTAYVFGELAPEAAADFEQELEKSKRLQEEVEAIVETVAVLKSEFESQVAGVGDTHREAIERAIGRRPASATEPPTPPPVVLDPATGSASERRVAVIAVMAASVLILGSLAYPYLRDRGDAAIAGDDSSTTIAMAVEQTKANKEIAGMVESFNQLIQERRYDEADLLAQRLAQMQPDHPIAVTLRNNSRMSRQLANGNVEAELESPTDQPITPLATQSGDDMFGGEDELAASMGQTADPTIAGRSLDLKQQADPKRQADPKQQAGVDPAQGGSRQISSHRDTGLKPLKLSADAGGGFGFGGSAAETPPASDPSPDDLIDSQTAIGDFSLDDSEVLAESPYDDSIDGLASNPRRPAKIRRRSGGDTMDMEEMMGMEMGMDAQMGGARMEMEDMMGMGMGISAQGDWFEPIEDNPFVDVDRSPLSTFSVDVDTASYAKVRSYLQRNQLPRPAAVRIEELLNYFRYGYRPPEDEHPFAASMEIASCPWNQQHRLARIGIQGKAIESDRPASNLVFLLDVSGSMDEPNKLPLVIEGMKMLTTQLNENDRVAIVVYAGAAGLVLDATSGDKKRQIISALDRLEAGGSTNGGLGIVLAYQIARDNFVVGGTNRVILCSDGDFNVGVTGTDQLVQIAQENAKSNVFLSVLGFGSGNHNDAMMEQISNQGNGNYAFIDSKSEARKVLMEELGGTLVTIAKDVKIQVEFNPKQVASYRLIGYENRTLDARDFNDDRKDAGEIGAGHTVTALYEIVPAVAEDARADDAAAPPLDELRYQRRARLSSRADSGEMLVLKLRYKQPEGDTSTLLEFPVTDSGKRFSRTDRDFKFAASVAAFGMLLRDSPHCGQATFVGVSKWAADGARGDDFGYRTEFLELVAKARQLRGQ